MQRICWGRAHAASHEHTVQSRAAPKVLPWKAHATHAKAVSIAMTHYARYMLGARNLVGQCMLVNATLPNDACYCWHCWHVNFSKLAIGPATFRAAPCRRGKSYVPSGGGPALSHPTRSPALRARSTRSKWRRHMSRADWCSISGRAPLNGGRKCALCAMGWKLWRMHRSASTETDADETADAQALGSLNREAAEADRHKWVGAPNMGWCLGRCWNAGRSDPPLLLPCG